VRRRHRTQRTQGIIFADDNMLLVKDDMEQVGTLPLFLSVGGDKFLQHFWKEDSDDQWEYNILLRSPGDDKEGDQVRV